LADKKKLALSESFQSPKSRTQPEFFAGFLLEQKGAWWENCGFG
jgi:hypothetical protein